MNDSRTLSIGLIMLILLLLMLGCGLTAPLPTQTPASTILPASTHTSLPPTETPTPTESPFVLLSITNDTEVMICGIFVTYVGFEGELPNLITPPMFPGGRITKEFEPGVYNIEVYDCQMNLLHEVRNFELVDALTWNLVDEIEGAEPDTLWIEVVNNRSYDLCEFYIRPGDSDDWGENILHPERGFLITAGSTYIEWIEGPGTYDLLLKDCAGNIARQLNDFEIPQNMTWTLTP